MDLRVHSTPDTVSILDGAAVITTHQRSFDKGKQIENETHIAGLAAKKKESRQHRGQDRLTQAAPSTLTFLIRAAERAANFDSRAVNSFCNS